MSSDTTLLIDQAARASLLAINSKASLRKLLQRIQSLQSFPQTGRIDTDAPPAQVRVERRISFVSPYAIRYEYDTARDEITIVSITNERSDSFSRFA